MENKDTTENDQSGKKRPRGDETDFAEEQSSKLQHVQPPKGKCNSPDEQSSKLLQVESLEEKSESNEPCCSFCMEEGTPTNPLLANHQCPQCSPNAWNLCMVCNEALLSRLCPMCRHEYAPMVMYKMPGKNGSSCDHQFCGS